MKLLILHMSATHGTEVHEGKMRFRCFHCDNPFDKIELLNDHVLSLDEEILRGYKIQTYTLNPGLESSKNLVDQVSTVHEEKMPLEKLTVSNPIKQPIVIDPNHEKVDTENSMATKVGAEKIITPKNYTISDKNQKPKFYNAKTNSYNFVASYESKALKSSQLIGPALWRFSFEN